MCHMINVDPNLLTVPPKQCFHRSWAKVNVHTWINTQKNASHLHFSSHCTDIATDYERLCRDFILKVHLSWCKRFDLKQNILLWLQTEVLSPAQITTKAAAKVILLKHFVSSHSRGDPTDILPAQRSVCRGYQRVPRIHQSFLRPPLCIPASLWRMLHQWGLLLHKYKLCTCQ